MKKRIVSMTIFMMFLVSFCALPVSVGATATPTSSFVQDFDSIAVGTTDAALASAAGFTLTSPNPGTIEVISRNGSNQMEVTSVAGPDTYHQIDYNFPQAISTGVIESSLKTDIYNIGAGAHAFLGVLNGATNRGMLSVFGNWYYFPADNLGGVGNQAGPTLNTTTNMYHLRTVIYRENASSNWNAMLYDDGGAEPVLMYSTTIDAATHPTITGIRLTNSWPVTGTQQYTLDDVRIDYYQNVTDYFPPAEFTGYSQNFDSIAVGTTDAALATSAGLTLTSPNPGTIEVISRNGSNQMEVTSVAGPDTYHQIDYNFPQAIATGVIESSLKTDIYNIGAGAHAFLGVLNGTTNRGMLSVFGNWYYFPADNLGGVGNQPGPTLNTTTNMYHLRTVVYREDTSSDWTAMIYDDGGDAPRLMYSTTIDAATHPTITGIRLTNSWPVTGTQQYTLDDININYYSTYEEFAPPTILTEDRYFIDEDFTDSKFDSVLDVAQTSAQMHTLVPELTFLPGSEGNYTVKELNGQRYLSIGGGSEQDVYGVRGLFDDINKGNVVVEMKYWLAGDYQDANVVYIGALNSCTVLSSTYGNEIESANYGKNIFGYPAGADTYKYGFTTDEYGFASIKYVLSRKNTTDNWKFDLYDGATNTYLDTATIPYSGADIETYISALNEVRFVNVWAMASSKPDIDITDLKVWVPKNLTFTTPKEYNRVSKTVYIRPSENLTAASVTAENITLKDENDNVITVTNASFVDGFINIVTDNVLDTGSYTVSFDGVTTARGTYVYDDCAFAITDPTGLTFSDLNATSDANSVTISVDVTNYNLEAVPVTVAFASYSDDEQSMKAVALSEELTNADGSAKTIEVTLNGASPDDRLKVFFLDLDDLRPLRSSEVVSSYLFR